MEISRGMRDKLDKYINAGAEFEVSMSIDGNDEYDFSCFGVDAAGKLSDDRYMIFYNQESSPQKEICYRRDGKVAKFRTDLSKLPQSIDKLVFTVNIDGNATMGSINAHNISISQNNQVQISLNLSGNDFKAEKAIISIEIYRKQGEWRFNAVARGFDGGLGDLLRFFGGEEATDATPAQVKQAVPEIKNIAPEIKQTAPEIKAAPVEIPEQKKEKISLKKGERVSLTKNKNNEPIIIENGWEAKGKDYDLKALVLYIDGRLVYVGAENKYEILMTAEGAVRHGGDVTVPGELEHINITWHPDIASVAVSSYSALENGVGSFRRYGVYLRIKNGNQTIEIPASDVSADEKSYTLCFGEILFGEANDSLEVVALELYSSPGSEKRVGYVGGKVVMDKGPAGSRKK